MNQLLMTQLAPILVVTGLIALVISAYKLNRIRNLTKGKVTHKSAHAFVGTYYIRHKDFFLITLGLSVLLLGAAAYAWLYP